MASVPVASEKEKELGDKQQLLRMAVSSVLRDDGFQLPTPLAERALKTAEKLLEWISERENEAKSVAFADSLISSLSTCFQPFKTMRVGRELMWEHFFKLRSSDEFKTKWKVFLRDSIGSESCPIFFQYVTDYIMERLIKQYYTVDVDTSAQSQMEPESLTYEEANALRYTAGYIICSLRKKIERSVNPLLEELVLCLVDLEEKEGLEEEHESEEWTNLVDRGGLKHISDITYMLFYSMEMELRQILHNGCASEEVGVKEKAMERISKAEDVLFYWSMVSTNWEEEESSELLQKIIEHWVTVRGFSFASAFLEKYKQKHKKSVQKSKGLRKKLQT